MDEIAQFWDQLSAQIRANIEKSGQHIQSVGQSPPDPPGTEQFMYTIGNFHLGLPELLIVDTSLSMFGDILNRLGRMQRERRRAFADEELVSVGGKFPLRIVDAGAIGRTRYATFVGIFYKTDNYDVRQVVLPDPQGRWPDTPGCALPYSRQPILSAIGRTRH